MGRASDTIVAGEVRRTGDREKNSGLLYFTKTAYLADTSISLAVVSGISMARTTDYGTDRGGSGFLNNRIGPRITVSCPRPTRAPSRPRTALRSQTASTRGRAK